jgi:tellurite resistance protein TerC
MLHRFEALAPALAAVLVFIGGKIVLAPWLGHGPAWVSLVVTVGLLAGGVAVSLWRGRGPQGDQRSRATSSAETGAAR